MFHQSSFLIDLDGVVYTGDTLCDGASEFVEWLNTTNKKYLFLTNSSAASQVQVSEKLHRLGIPVSADCVIGAGEAAVRSIARRFPGSGVYLIGEPAMADLLMAHGLFLANENPRDARVVLCCLDRSFNYDKLAGAVTALRHGAVFISANRDPLLPTGPDVVRPGCGAIAAAVEAAAGMAPEVIGKPQGALFEEAMRKLDSLPGQTVMIGDNLHIDVLGAHRAGLSAVLVLSGVSKEGDLKQAQTSPDHVFKDLSGLLAALRAHPVSNG